MVPAPGPTPAHAHGSHPSLSIVYSPSCRARRFLSLSPQGSAASTSKPTTSAPVGAPPSVDMSGGVFEEMFGAELCAKGGEIVQTSAALADKVVAIYFSAHWCPPCRGFTPELAKAYATYKAAGKNLEIVFASSDRDEKAFGEYFAEMPWLALPFSERDRKEKLSSKFKVRGIPTLVILDTDGSVITTDGRSAVSEDPTGAAFPWKPKPLSELLGGGLVLDADTKGAKVPAVPRLHAEARRGVQGVQGEGARSRAHLRFVRPRREELRRVLFRDAVARAALRRARPQERALEGLR